MKAWYSRPVAAACLAMATLAASAHILIGAEYGPRESTLQPAYAVTIHHNGIDAREMERSVAVPLEDALASIAGALEVSSSSEYGKARVVVEFSPGVDAEAVYESVRDAGQRVYEGLPSSAQRPEFSSASERRGPVWVAAVYSERYADEALGRVMEHKIKPALQKLSGAGDVELAGTGLPEIVVEVDGRFAGALGVTPESVAGYLAELDLLAPAGTISFAGGDAAIIADGRFTDLDELASALIPSASGTPVPLGVFSRILRHDRIPDALSRVDGKPAITIAIEHGAGSNLAALSRAIARETEVLSKEYDITFRVLSDVGADVAKSFLSTLGAAGQGVLAVAVASALLIGTGMRGNGSRCPRPVGAMYVVVAAVPAILVVAAASMAVLGYGMDGYVLAGLAVGLGAAVDASILATERLMHTGSFADGAAAMGDLAPSLASGTATTIVVLIPLARLDFLSEGVARIASAIAAVSIVAYVVTVSLIPPIVLNGLYREGRQAGLIQQGSSGLGLRRFSRFGRLLYRAARRTLAMNAKLCADAPMVAIVAALIVSVCGAAAILLSPTDLQGGFNENAVYVHLEFEPGAAASSVDERLAEYSESLAGSAGIDGVQTTARRGSGSALVRFNPRLTKRDAVAERCRTMGVHGGFAWIPESSDGESAWDVSVAGDDDEICRKIAEKAAMTISALPFVLGTVLNFKEGPEDVILIPDRGLAASRGVIFAQAADSMRRGVYGPVAYKRIATDGETDVRVTTVHGRVPMDSLRPGIADLNSILIQTGAGVVRTDSLMRIARECDAARIYRSNRRRIATITMRTRPIDPRKAREEVMGAVLNIERKAGYSFEFDRKAIQSAESLDGAALSFAFAAVLAYMVIAFITESFGAPLVVLSSLPPSLAVPAILLFVTGTPVDAGIACAFIAVSGIVVNASVLTVDARRTDTRRLSSGNFPAMIRGSVPASAMDLYRMTRIRIGALAATGGTSIAGALPFLFLLDSGGSMARSLAFVTATGTAASFIAALTVVPALARLLPGFFRNFEV